ncbi:MAG: GNAT family N-acetyltransferase [Lachnospiraceae bacterium]|nr:GNAT family N-acetyltransferase [Lachnospiraceae bacterium]
MIPDVTIYFELRKSVGWEIFCKEQAQQALRNSCHFVLAKDGEKSVAMGRCVGDGMYYVIVDVVVRPEYQGKQIGATIINRLVELMKKDMPLGARISIQLISAQGKETFYEKQGFERLPHDHCGPGFNRVFYTT